MRFSLREMLVAFAAVPVAFVALLYATWWSAWVVTLATAAVILLALDRALVGRGERRIRGLAFAVPAIVYATLVLWSENRPNQELDPYSGRMTTSTALKTPFEWVAGKRSYFRDPTTGVVTKTQPPGTELFHGGGFGGGGVSIGGGFPKYVEYVEVPRRQDFMTIGHCLWTLLLGYVCSRYAAWVVERRRAQDNVEQRLPGS